MRLVAATLAAAALGSAAVATSQGAAPSANTIATAEVIFHCGATLARLDDLFNFGLVRDEDRFALDDETLDAVDARYAAALTQLTTEAAYPAASIVARAAVHKQQVSKIDGKLIPERMRACAHGVQTPAQDRSDPPKSELSFAMAGKGANDILYVDMASLDRLGSTVAGWQLYVFRASQPVGGVASKASWTRFRVDCVQPAITTYGVLGIADPGMDAAFTADTRGPANSKALAPNTFGAATWMLACGVTIPATTYPDLKAAAAHTAAQFPTP